MWRRIWGWWGILLSLDKSVGERILKINQHLAKLETKIQWHLFFKHGLYCTFTVVRGAVLLSLTAFLATSVRWQLQQGGEMAGKLLPSRFSPSANYQPHVHRLWFACHFQWFSFFNDLDIWVWFQQINADNTVFSATGWTRVFAAADRPAQRWGSAHAKYSVSHNVIIKPFLLHGLAAECRSRWWMWSTVVRRPSDVYDIHRQIKLTAPETISRFRDMVVAHQNLNGSCDLTTSLSEMVFHLRDSTCYRQPTYQIWNLDLHWVHSLQRY